MAASDVTVDDDPLDFAGAYAVVTTFEDVGEEYERILRRAYEAVLRPGDDAIDVGAHLGKHSLPLALAVAPTGSVTALEPIPWAHARLCARATGAGVDNIEVVHGCVGAEHEEGVPFDIVVDHPGWSARAVRPAGGRTERVEVTQHTVDELAAGRPLRFLKIDVEGFEPAVLIGAHETLRTQRPVVHVEVSPDALDANGVSVDDVRRPLVDAGYRIFDVLGNDVTAETSWRASASARGAFDYLAVHEDDTETIERIRAVLARSFLTERSDLAGHGRIDLLPDLATRTARTPPAGRPTIATDPGPDLPPEITPGPPSPVASSWPSSDRVVGRHAVLWGPIGAGVMTDLLDGQLTPLDRPVALTLPVDGSPATLAPGRELVIELDIDGNQLEGAVRGHRTLVEAHFADRGASAVVRIHAMGQLDVLWIEGATTIGRDAFAAGPGLVRIRLSRLRSGGWLLSARQGQRLATTRLTGAGNEAVDVTIGRRHYWVNPEPWPAASIPATVEVTALRGVAAARASWGDARARARNRLRALIVRSRLRGPATRVVRAVRSRR